MEKLNFFRGETWVGRPVGLIFLLISICGRFPASRWLSGHKICVFKFGCRSPKKTLLFIKSIYEIYSRGPQKKLIRGLFFRRNFLVARCEDKRPRESTELEKYWMSQKVYEWRFPGLLVGIIPRWFRLLESIINQSSVDSRRLKGVTKPRINIWPTTGTQSFRSQTMRFAWLKKWQISAVCNINKLFSLLFYSQGSLITD